MSSVTAMTNIHNRCMIVPAPDRRSYATHSSGLDGRESSLLEGTNANATRTIDTERRIRTESAQTDLFRTPESSGKGRQCGFQAACLHSESENGYRRACPPLMHGLRLRSVTMPARLAMGAGRGAGIPQRRYSRRRSGMRIGVDLKTRRFRHPLRRAYDTDTACAAGVLLLAGLKGACPGWLTNFVSLVDSNG